MQKFVADFRPLISGMLILLLTIIVPFDLTAQSDKLKVYVWDFTTRDRIRDDLTRKFTVEFEEALIQAKYYDILLRRDYDKIFSQKTNEKGILSIEGIPRSQLDSLKILQADAIIFGEIYDDSKGGVIRITISLQAFNSKILAQHSTHLRRGLKDDPVSREKTMSELAKKFSPVEGVITPKSEKANLSISGTPSGARVYINGNYTSELPLKTHTVKSGNVTVCIKESGYEVYKTRLKLAVNQHKELFVRLQLKTKQKAIIKSLAFPGWGQYYAEQNNKAIIYALCETAALAGAFLFNHNHSQAIDDFNIAKDRYAAAVSQADMDQYFQQMETKYDDIKNAEKIRNLCIGVAAGMWVWNVLDAALFDPKPEQKAQLNKYDNNKLELSAKCVAGNGFIGLCLKF